MNYKLWHTLHHGFSNQPPKGMGQVSWGIRGNLAFLLSLALPVQILLSVMKANVASFTLIGNLAEWTTFILSPSLGAHFKIYLAVNHNNNLICTKHVKTFCLISLFSGNWDARTRTQNLVHAKQLLDNSAHLGLKLRAWLVTKRRRMTDVVQKKNNGAILKLHHKLSCTKNLGIKILK